MVRAITCCTLVALLAAGCGAGATAHDRTPALPRSVAWTTTSKAVPGRTLHQYALVPRGGTKHRPLLILLHGFGNGSRSWIEPPVPKLLADLGDEAPVVISPDGGQDSWWINRASGRWADYVSDEVIADAVRRFGVDPERVAVAGFSMGGLGAFSLGMHHPRRFCALGGYDAAIVTSFRHAVRTEFDSHAQFTANDVLAYAGTPGAYPNTPLVLDRGYVDLFNGGEDAFAAALKTHVPPIDYRVQDGTHSMRSIRPHLRHSFQLYAAALHGCAPARVQPTHVLSRVRAAS